MTEEKKTSSNQMQIVLQETKSPNNRSPTGKEFSTATAMTKLMPLTLYAIASVQNEQQIFVGKIRAKEFLENANWKADQWDPEKKKSSGSGGGYQRVYSKRKADDFGRFMTKHPLNFTPSSLYLNIRDTERDRVKLTKVHENGELYKITIQDRTRIWVVDGQHRLEGLSRILDISDDPDIELPIMLTIGVKKSEEMFNFVTMNKARTNVKVDLAERDLADNMKKDSNFKMTLLQRDSTVFKDIEFVEKAILVMDGVYENTSSPWYKRILMPNEKKTDLTTVSSASFVDSLEPLMKKSFVGGKKAKPQPALANVDEEVAMKHINAVWKGIKLVNPVMFKKENACNYVIQHTIGTMAIHLVLAKMHINGDSDKLKKSTAENFKKIFSISNLKDQDLWAKGEKGSYGGKFTNYGTNKKSFSFIADILYKEIQKTPAWQQYKD
jgi:DGQHR domain-containing protein